MKNLKKVYIAGKLNDETCIDYLNNCGLMMEHANDVHKAGYAVFIEIVVNFTVFHGPLRISTLVRVLFFVK